MNQYIYYTTREGLTVVIALVRADVAEMMSKQFAISTSREVKTMRSYDFASQFPEPTAYFHNLNR